MSVQSVLAAIVMVSLKGVFLQAHDVRDLYNRSQYFDLVYLLLFHCFYLYQFDMQIRCDEGLPVKMSIDGRNAVCGCMCACVCVC